MSTAWIKELLLDYGMGLLSVEQRTEISSAIATLITAQVFTKQDIYMLHDYIAGYTAKEIAERNKLAESDVVANLARMTFVLSYATGYTDDTIIYRAEQRLYPKVHKFKEYLKKHAADFNTHGDTNEISRD
jgi:CRISPR/Cas system CSM-associated protein Csm2 small subunit